jgi:tRNA(Arg) A34 adenosine deaminase TadA
MKLYAEQSGESKIRTLSQLTISPPYQTVTTHGEVEALRKIAENPNTYELLSKLIAQIFTECR